jgi:hypothetical protein
MSDDLPPGFTLEEDTGLPEGFVLEEAAPSAPAAPAEPALLGREESIRRELMTLRPSRSLGSIRPSEEQSALATERERTRSLGELQLLEGNIKIGEAPVDARMLSGYGLNRLQGYKSVLEPLGYQVKEVTSEGPYKGEIIYRYSGSDPWTTVREPEGFMNPTDVGARVRDVQSLRGTAVPEVLGAAAGAAGAAARLPMVPLLKSGLLAAGAAGGTARYYAEVSRMEEGRRLGVIPKDVSDAEIQAVALGDAFQQAIGEASGVALYNVLKFGAVRGLPDMSGLTPERLRQGIAAARADAGPGAENLITVGDVLAKIKDPRADFFKSVEQKTATTFGMKGHEEMRQRAVAKELAVGEQASTAMPGGPPVNVTQLGEDIATRVAPGFAEFRGDVLSAGGKVAQRPDTGLLASDVVDAVKEAEKAQKSAIQALYRRAESGAAGATDTLIESEAVLKDLADSQGGRLFPSLSKDQRKLVKDSVGTFYERVETPGRFAADGETFIPGEATFKLKPASLEQMNKAINDIRDAIRNKYRGEWKGDLNELAEIEEALVKDRNRLLMKTGGRQSVDDFEAADLQWKQMKDTFRREKIQKAFKVSPNLSSSRTAEEALDSLSIDFDTAQQINRYISQSERDRIRAMLQIQVADIGRAYGKAQNEIRDAAVQRVVNAEDSPLRVFFTDAERANMFNAANLQRIRRQIGVAENESMSGWIDKFYNDMNIDQANAVFTRLRKDPSFAPIAETIKQTVRQRLYNDLTKEGPMKEARVLDVDKFTAMIGDPAKERWLGMVMDSGFLTRLGEVAKATETVLPQVAKVNLPAGEAASGSLVMAAAKKARTLVGPLRQQSRFLTAGMQAATGEMQQRIARAILDPEYFAKLIASGTNTAGGRATAATLGAALMEDKIGDKTGRGDWMREIPASLSRTTERAMGVRQ